MTIKATFPHAWFTEDDQPDNNHSSSSGSSGSSNNKAKISSPASKAAHHALPGGETPITTPDLTRRNSFDFIMDMAKRAEAAAASASVSASTATAPPSVPGETPTRPTATASRASYQEGNTYVQRRALPGPPAKRVSVHSEPIELSNLPKFTRSGEVGGEGPVTPAAAHLARRRGLDLAYSLDDSQRKRLKMGSRFYAASGIAYTTPAAFFAPSRREPEQLHPALRRKHSSARQESREDGSGLRPESRRTRSSATKSAGTKATSSHSKDKAAPPSQRGGPSTVNPASRSREVATNDETPCTAKSTRVRGAKAEIRQPGKAHCKDRRPHGLARFVGEIRFGCALLRLWNRRLMARSLERRGYRDRWQ
ncbi:hypothetical protein LTR74_012214 [Friedmanniomyces endolithicus]|nr:hypothetical protein LTR74_012214 [Friedmanniomyces endolithicus]